MSTAVKWMGCALIFGALVGCSEAKNESPGGDDGPQSCLIDLDCNVGFRCDGGVCVEGTTPEDPEPEGQPDPQPDGNPAPGPAPEPDPEPEDPGCQPTAEVCDGADNDCDGEIDEEVDNGCGGCNILVDPLDSPCGRCGGGTFVCDGPSSTRCEGAAPENGCGGCGVLEGAVGGSCGVCGQYACNGTDAVVCEDSGSNACGGCTALAQQPESECGFCGRTECDGTDAVVCNDPGEEACGVVRFIAMGDTGEANEDQYRVSRGAQARCDRAGGCDGFIMLGDNIYDEGAESPTDNQFTTKIDMPYRNLKKGPAPGEGLEDLRERMPIYVALGNHDLGGAGLNSAQVSNYLAYSAANPWFVYPDEFFDVQVGLVHLVSIHTNPLAYLGQLMEPQGQLVQNVVQNTSATWTIVFGHHPYRSEGRHGNAGSYEGIPGDLFFLGGMFRQWIDEYVCNQADFYLSGHDHNRQWLAEVPDIPTWPLFAENRVPCRTHFAVSGAGAKTTDFEDRGNELDFGAETEGFLLMEFHSDHAVVEFCDADGNTEWTKTIMR